MKSWIGTATLGLLATAATGLGLAASAKGLEWLAQRRDLPEGDFVEVEGVRLHYLDRGPRNAAVVAILPGNGAMVQDMDASGVLALADKRYRVITFDRPGYGWSERPRGTDWTPEAQADLIAKALGRLGVRHAVVVGHSWGTLVAIALALRSPALVRGLVLASGYYFPSRRTDVVLAKPSAAPVIGDVLRWTLVPVVARAASEKVLRMLFAPMPVPERFRREFPLELAFRPGAIRASAEEGAGMVAATRRLRGRYADLRCPVVILVGDGDRLIEPDQSGRLHDAIPQSTLVVVHGAGHMVHHRAPERIVDAIDQVARAQALAAAA